MVSTSFLTFVPKGNYSITECVTSHNILLGYCTVTMVGVAAAEPTGPDERLYLTITMKLIV